MLRAFSLLLAATMASTASAGSNLVKNGDFEQGLTGWSTFWSRSGGGSAELATEQPQQGKQAARIQYDGKEDWSFPQTESLRVQPGDIFELSGWIRMRGEGSASLSVILYDAENKSLSWDFGGRPIHRGEPWHQVHTRFMIPPSGATVVPRLMGYGAAEVWLDDVALVKTGTIEQLQARELPATISIESPSLRVTFAPPTATVHVLDKRTQREFTQQPGSTLVVLGASSQDNQITFQLLKPDDVLTVDGTIRLEPDAAEFVVELTGKGEMRQLLSFPLPFDTRPGQFLIVPVNEGISYPVDDATLPTMQYHLFGGHGLCMGFWGCTDLQSGLMAIVETPDDARDRNSATRRASLPGSPVGCSERPVRSRAVSATSRWTRAGTSPCANAIANTPNRSVVSRRWQRNAKKTPTWTDCLARSTSGAGISRERTCARRCKDSASSGFSGVAAARPS